jgi:hypothetical protein
MPKDNLLLTDDLYVQICLDKVVFVIQSSGYLGIVFHSLVVTGLCDVTFSEILATYRLRCVDSSIAIQFTDNTNDNLATITSIYERNGMSYWSNLGTDVDLSISLKRNVKLFFSAGAVWQPRGHPWINVGAEMFAGGQNEYADIYSTLIKFNCSLGLSLNI